MILIILEVGRRCSQEVGPLNLNNILDLLWDKSELTHGLLRFIFIQYNVFWCIQFLYFLLKEFKEIASDFLDICDSPIKFELAETLLIFDEFFNLVLQRFTTIFLYNLEGILNLIEISLTIFYLLIIPHFLHIIIILKSLYDLISAI